MVKIKNILFLLIISSSLSFTQTNINHGLLYEESNLLYEKSTGKLFTGISKQIVDKSDYGPFRKMYYLNSISEGLITQIDIHYYKNDQFQRRVYFDSKQKMREYSDENETVKEYHLNGKVKFETKHKNGTRVNSFHYLDDGSLYGQYNYKKGFPHGYWTIFYPDGSIEYEEQYKEGERHGTQKSFYENGKTKSISNYIDGKQEGWSKIFNDDGTVWMEKQYKNDELHGISRYYLNNDIRSEEIYKDGELIDSKEY
jgi:antitoxin component YwqK of YwqJK toxin-antitoxin module